jgi:hypothetical protein
MQASREDVLHWVEKDYDDARNAVDKFDGQLFTIRNWAVTSAGALLALGFSTSQWVVPVVGLVSVVLFGYLEMTYKCFHEDALFRGRQMEGLIEQALAGGDFTAGYRFGLSHAFHAPTVKRILKMFLMRRHITLLYAGLAIALAAAAIVIAIDR